MIDFRDYSRKRAALKKRLERLTAKEPNNNRANAILNRLNRETVAELRRQTPRRQEMAMEKLEGWLGLKSLSLTGVKQQRKAAVKRLQEEHYGVTDANFDKFVNMMELSRSLLDAALYDSEEAATYASEHISNPAAFVDYLMSKVARDLSYDTIRR